MPSQIRRYLDDPVAAWRTGTRGSQGITLAVLLLVVGVCFVTSLTNYPVMPMTAYYVWLLIGMMLLRFLPLAVLCTFTGAARRPSSRCSTTGR